MVGQSVVGRLAGWAGIAVWLVQSAAGMESQAEELSYKFQPGQTLVYETRIEVDHGNYLEVFAGHPRLVVKSATAEQFLVEFRGGLEASARMKGNPETPFRGLYRPPMGLTGLLSSESKPSEISLNARGRDFATKGSSQLPYLLGDLSELILVPLPKKQEREWNKSRDLKLIISDRLLPRPMLLRDDSMALATSEEIDFRIEGEEGGAARIRKEYRLATAEKVENKPRVEVTGEGTIGFDRERGLVTRLDYRQRLVSRSEKSIQETPMVVTYRLLSEAEAASVEAEAKRGLNAEELAAVLVDLKNEQKAAGRILTLQKKAPANPNPEVGAALVGYLESDKQATRYAAAKALEVWATEAQSPNLQKALGDPHNIVRHAALKGLARVNPELAAASAAKMLTVDLDRLAASAVLKSIGRSAEPAVIPVLQEANWQVRLEAIRVLTEIGSGESVAALEPVMTGDENILNRNTAKTAIEAIQKRGK